MSLLKTIRTEKISLSGNEPSRTIFIGKGEQYFNLVTSVALTSPLAIMLVTKGKVTCIPFLSGDRDSCYELEQAEKIVITLDENDRSVPVSLTINIW